MKRKLLILSYTQFGYLTDTLKYCEYIRNEYDITYLGWDYGLPKIEMEGVKVEYISREGNIVKRNMVLLRAFNRKLKDPFDLVFANYFRGASLIRLLNPRKRMILDIRTLAVSASPAKRLLFNSSIRLESLFYKKVSVISAGVAGQLWGKGYHVLPLGADAVSSPSGGKDDLHLLYVGTLQNRDIIKCVKGFHRYIEETGDKAAVFTIIGDSPYGELEEIRNFVVLKGMEKQVLCLGRIAHRDLARYFAAANVGVAFIPMTSYYDHQPPTKTFEYLLSGLAVIGTRTKENSNVLTGNAGAILIDDNEEEFAAALPEIKNILKEFDAAKSVESSQQYSWHSIVTNDFLPLIKGQV
jgi:glycosyltransferase involved in cell wall biosynthesis